eukprot:TRINITY_DN43505_c0_g1_i1.p1 TRINITY_DN43505_c0_g1~~TRINITY_DN43505_c0_g1_i1.p1  ORF type:complete len:215 (-),score=45.03 TRINITY_DN43505_c0_g1_i1:136-780(-)
MHQAIEFLVCIQSKKIIMNKTLLKSIGTENTVWDQFPFKITPIYQQKVYHSFAKQLCCQINVTLHIQNINSEDEINCITEAINSDETYLELNNTKFPIFIWEGQIKKIFTLKYYESIEIKLRALVTQPGLYDINRFKFSFYRNAITKKITEPLSLKACRVNENIEKKQYFSQNIVGTQEFLIEVINNERIESQYQQPEIQNQIVNQETEAFSLI